MRCFLWSQLWVHGSQPGVEFFCAPINDQSKVSNFSKHKNAFLWRHQPEQGRLSASRGRTAMLRRRNSPVSTTTATWLILSALPVRAALPKNCDAASISENTLHWTHCIHSECCSGEACEHEKPLKLLKSHFQVPAYLIIDFLMIKPLLSSSLYFGGNLM